MPVSARLQAKCSTGYTHERLTIFSCDSTGLSKLPLSPITQHLQTTQPYYLSSTNLLSSSNITSMLDRQSTMPHSKNVLNCDNNPYTFLYGA
jgi:hypothetical protein